MKKVEKKPILLLVGIAVVLCGVILLDLGLFEKTDSKMIEISFKDENFYKATLDQMGSFVNNDDKRLTIVISEEELKDITELTYKESAGAEIKDISGIKNFTSLKKLILQGSDYLEDISELSYLTDLEILSIDNNENISDLSPIEGLTNLKELDLDYNGSMKNIENINALANLTNLTSLDTSVYNMDYTVELSESKSTKFELPKIFASAENGGDEVTFQSNLDGSVIEQTSEYIEVKVNKTSDVIYTIVGGVYDSITCNIKFVVN